MVTQGKFTLSPINARSFALTGPLETLFQSKDGDKIVRLYTEDGLIYSIGKTIIARPKYPFKLNLILPVTDKRKKIVQYNFYTAGPTLSSSFVLPFLGGDRKTFLWGTSFINCFIGTGPEDAKKVIALLYRFSGERAFLEFENALSKFRNFIRRYDPDPYHVMFVFEVPGNAIKSYEHFINGRYSEIDDLWKLKILEFHSFEIDGFTGQVLFKTESRRRELERQLGVDLPENAELYSIIDESVEVFDPNIYLPDRPCIG